MLRVTRVLPDGETAYRLSSLGLSARRSTPVRPGDASHAGPAEFAPPWLMQPIGVSCPVLALRANSLIALPVREATYTKPSVATTHAACPSGRLGLLGH